MVWLSLGLGLLVVVGVMVLAVVDFGGGGRIRTEEYSSFEDDLPDEDDDYGSGLDEGIVAHDPQDAESSVASIRAAHEAAFDPATTEDEWLAVVAAPPEVGEELRVLADSCGTATTVIEEVVFVSDDAATVFFHFVNTPGGIGDGESFSGTAERIDGTWQVSRYTIDKVLLNASPFCN